MCDAVHSIADGTKQRCRKSDYLSRSDDRKCRYFQDMINSAHDIRERVVRLRPSNCKIENSGDQESQRLTTRTFVDWFGLDRKSTRLNSSHLVISYAVFCLKKKN